MESEKKYVQIEKWLLIELIYNYRKASGLCNELNIYEWERGQTLLDKMDEWVDENFSNEYLNSL